MYYLGRIVGAFFNQFFRFLFWNKKGQKILFIAVIFVIAVCFIKLGEVSAVEEVTDINYDVYHYYDQVTNDVILRLESLRKVSPDNAVFTYINNPGYYFYFYYGDPRGTSYNNAVPINQSRLYILPLNKGWVNGGTFVLTPNNNDYMGVTGFDMFNVTKSDNSNFSAFDIDNNNNIRQVSYAQYSINRTLMLYTSTIWREYIEALNNDDIQTITTLLEDIKAEQQQINENLTNDDVSNVSADLPQDTAVDPTDSLWGDMFDQVRTAVTSTSVSPISITIPFIDYSVVIEPAIYSPMTRIRNIMRPLYDFIILSWWFGASMWIVKDIHRYLEQIKNGDITAKDTNIKTEVL